MSRLLARGRFPFVDLDPDRMRVLFVTAECSPLVRVGGLADAAAGLVHALRRLGASIDLVIPDIGGTDGLEVECEVELAVPDWVGSATARFGAVPGFGSVIVMSTPALARPHLYNDPATGLGWPDNDARFFGFAAAAAAVADHLRPDLVHLNDWHSAAASSWIDPSIPQVLAIHNLAYQGEANRSWVDRLGPRRSAFEWNGQCNPLAGAIRLADRVVTVSPTYAAETKRPEFGAGLESLLRDRRTDYVGIRNGIDTDLWDPERDPYLPAHFSVGSVQGKGACREALRERVGCTTRRSGPLVGLVARLVEQKGIDIAVGLVAQIDELGGRLVVMGRGEPALEAQLTAAQEQFPDAVSWLAETDESVAHLMMAGCDLLLVPSRFEPCGLTPMEAMRYGTIPVVAPVGGLRDSVVDASGWESTGNGFVAPAPDVVGMSLALSRAVRVWSDPIRRSAVIRNAMRGDWSWRNPAERYLEVYDAVTSRSTAQGTRLADDSTGVDRTTVDSR